MIRSPNVSLTPVPVFMQLNRARKHEDMAPLSSDEELNTTLEAAGFTHCEGKKYPWAR